MGTPHFAVPTLKNLIASDNHEVVAVFTAPPKAQGRGLVETLSPVHQLAAEHGIDVYTPASLKSDEITALVDSIESDIIVVVAYGFIITKAILGLKKYGCLNIHPSSLPKYRGAAPLQRTIINDEKETSVCIMQMDEGLDTGDIILQESFSLHNRITMQELHDKCAEIGARLLLQTLEHIDTLPRMPQSVEGLTYAHKLKKEESLIDWTQSARKIDCQIRGMNPWPGAYFTYDGKVIKILEAESEQFVHQFTPGTVINDKLSVACGEGVLHVKKLQQAGKSALSAAEFLRGTPIALGSSFIPNSIFK